MAEEIKETVETTETEPEVDFAKEVERLSKELDALKGENTHLKTTLSNKNAENADYKRKERERMTEDERANAERAEKDAAIQKELEELRAERRVARYTAQLVSNGYDAETADVMAKALPDGIGDDFFASQKTFIDKTIANVKAEALNSQPSITPGAPVKAKKEISKEDFDKMGYTARAKLKNENPELYDKLIN